MECDLFKTFNVVRSLVVGNFTHAFVCAHNCEKNPSRGTDIRKNPLTAARKKSC